MLPFDCSGRDGKDHRTSVSFQQVHSLETSVIESAYITLRAEKGC